MFDNCNVKLNKIWTRELYKRHEEIPQVKFYYTKTSDMT